MRMTELKEQLNKELDKNVKAFYDGDLTYEEFHAVQEPIIKKLKMLNGEIH
jgi:hypothetical protein